MGEGGEQKTKTKKKKKKKNPQNSKNKLEFEKFCSGNKEDTKLNKREEKKER